VNGKNRRVLPLAAVLGLIIGIAIVVAFFAVRRQMKAQPAPAPAEARPAAQAPSPSPSPSIINSPSPEQAVTTTSQTSPTTSETRAAHATTTSGPISTTAKVSNAKTNRKPVILLASGGKIEADEVWHTNDGIWYRRNGLVTLLKKNRVKAIVSQ
jgi:cytoskeletal protein RodZ